MTDKTQSAHLVKKLVSIGISNIAYLRHLFPEAAFADRSLEDMSLKVLRQKSGCPEAEKMVTWLQGLFEAIDLHAVSP